MTEQATPQHMTLWDSVRTPDPSATKSFSRSGGFKGTATNAVYLIQRATELWGPMGGKWGVDIVEDRVFQGAPMLGDAGQVIGHEQLHVIRISLRHPDGVVPGYGQTMMVGKNKWGPFTDEEAPKKSLTDALTKAMSWLGFAADIHLGLWDDNKYVNEAKKAFDEAKKDTPPPPANPPQVELLTPEEIANVTALANEVGKPLEDITKAYKVGSLNFIKRSAYAPIIKNLTKLKTTSTEGAQQ